MNDQLVNLIVSAVWEKPFALPCWQFMLKHITVKGKPLGIKHAVSETQADDV